MFNLLSFAMYRSMSFELKYAVNSVALKLYAGAIQFIFAPGGIKLYINIYIIFYTTLPPSIFGTQKYFTRLADQQLVQ